MAMVELRHLIMNYLGMVPKSSVGYNFSSPSRRVQGSVHSHEILGRCSVALNFVLLVL